MVSFVNLVLVVNPHYKGLVEAKAFLLLDLFEHIDGLDYGRKAKNGR